MGWGEPQGPQAHPENDPVVLKAEIDALRDELQARRAEVAGLQRERACLAAGVQQLHAFLLLIEPDVGLDGYLDGEVLAIAAPFASPVPVPRRHLRIVEDLR